MKKANKILEAEVQRDLQHHVRCILQLLGADINSEGIKETPARVAKMFGEVFEGMNYTNEEIAMMFDKQFEVGPGYEDLVIVQDIPIFSYCEHHMALMYNMKVHVAYVAKDKVLGLSKIARIADMVGKRLQLQERIGKDIADIMQRVLGVDHIMVIIEGEHSCMTARGIKKNGSVTRTSTARGYFMERPALRNEAMTMIYGGR